MSKRTYWEARRALQDFVVPELQKMKSTLVDARMILRGTGKPRDGQLELLYAELQKLARRLDVVERKADRIAELCERVATLESKLRKKAKR